MADSGRDSIGLVVPIVINDRDGKIAVNAFPDIFVFLANPVSMKAVHNLVDSIVKENHYRLRVAVLLD